jgi:hypothetical protein
MSDDAAAFRGYGSREGAVDEITAELAAAVLGSSQQQ